MDELGCSRQTAHNKLEELVNRGALETRKIGARGGVVDTAPRRHLK